MPMCGITKCSAQKNKNRPGITFHRFPKSVNLRQKWLNAIGTENLNPRHKVHWVCSLHFKEHEFNRTLDVVRLRENTVPSLFRMIPKTSKSEQDLHTFSQTPPQLPNLTRKKDITQEKDIAQEIIYIQSPESPKMLDSIEKEKEQDMFEVAKTLSQLRNMQKKKSETETDNEEEFQVQQNIQIIRQQEHIKRLTQMCMEQRKKIKRLHEEVRKKNKKIAFLKNAIEDLKTTNKMNYAQNIVMIVLD